MSRRTEELDLIAEQLRQDLTNKDSAREKALPICREVIRYCSTSIRAVHRHEFDEAKKLLDTARGLLDKAARELSVGCELLNLTFLRDAQKEYAEGNLTLALVIGMPLPQPGDLGVDPAAYLNGMGEAVGELRRYLLDSMRQDDMYRSEELLTAMDDIYNVLVTMDFPDAITGGLRRTTDMVRGVLERTRSDITLLMRQSSLEKKLEKVERQTP